MRAVVDTDQGNLVRDSRFPSSSMASHAPRAILSLKQKIAVGRVSRIWESAQAGGPRCQSRAAARTRPRKANRRRTGMPASVKRAAVSREALNVAVEVFISAERGDPSVSERSQIRNRVVRRRDIVDIDRVKRVTQPSYPRQARKARLPRACRAATISLSRRGIIRRRPSQWPSQ